ncbi:MAG: LicD family protein [Bacteroidales bacterium]|nr:LicD family protein [Bacteroidales bacterium]
MIGKELTIDQVKSISMDILDEVHSFCVKNNLRYSLFSGTLLGCIRHKGFIPWDDDIDIAMPREDYEIFARTFKSDKYEFINHEKCSWYYLPWGKVADLSTIKNEPVYVKKEKYGVDIDIYPCDYIETIEQGKYLKKKLGKIDRARGHSVRLYNKNIIKNFFTLFYRGKHIKYCFKENSISSQFNSGKHMYFFRNNAFSKSDDIYPIELFDNTILMPFENRKYLVTSLYDKVLTIRYGDYMKPPADSNERKPHHLNNTRFIE